MESKIRLSHKAEFAANDSTLSAQDDPVAELHTCPDAADHGNGHLQHCKARGIAIKIDRDDRMKTLVLGCFRFAVSLLALISSHAYGDDSSISIRGNLPLPEDRQLLKAGVIDFVIYKAPRYPTGDPSVEAWRYRGSELIETRLSTVGSTALKHPATPADAQSAGCPAFTVDFTASAYGDYVACGRGSAAGGPDATVGYMPPSIQSGLASQYTVRKTSFTIESLLSGCDSSGCVEAKADIVATWRAVDSYGGHASHQKNFPRPVGMVQCKQNRAGDITAPGSGTANANPVVSCSLSPGYAFEQDDQITYTAPENAGRFLLTITDARSWPPGSRFPAPGTLTYVYDIYVDLNHAGFQRLYSVTDQKSFLSPNRFVTGFIDASTRIDTPSHTSTGGYGTSGMQSAMQTLVESYTSCLIGPANAGKTFTLFVTGSSLQYGGLLDVNDDWKPPHKNHRGGENIDISLAGISQHELDCLSTAIGTGNGPFTMNVPSESITRGGPLGGHAIAPADDGPHVHLWTRETSFYGSPSPRIRFI